MRKLTIKEAYELNNLFKTNKFKSEMTSVNLYTSILSINLKRISPDGNNLRIIQCNEHIHKLEGRFIDKNKRLLHLVGYSSNGDIIKEFDFNCSELYQVKKGKQIRDINKDNVVEFTKLNGNIFIPRSKYYGFKVLSDKKEG